jgi:ABC-2 type transport system ATP-binding protein
MSERAILTEGLSKSFGAQSAVSNLNLQIQPGAVYGFLGRNGPGKTTTMRMLLGLVRPTKGSARVLGLDPTREAELMRILERVAFVPQRKQLYGWATPAELVRMNKPYFPRWSDGAAAQLAQRLEIPMKMARTSRQPFEPWSCSSRSFALANTARVRTLRWSSRARRIPR